MLRVGGVLRQHQTVIRDGELLVMARLAAISEVSNREHMGEDHMEGMRRRACVGGHASESALTSRAVSGPPAGSCRMAVDGAHAPKGSW